MTHDKGKWLWPGILLAIIATLAIVALAAQSNESGSSGECQWANDFTDSNGQVWSVTDIQATNIGCEAAIEVALERGEQSVGIDIGLLQPAYEARGWNCDSNSVCTKDKSEVTFALELH